MLQLTHVLPRPRIGKPIPTRKWCSLMVERTNRRQSTQLSRRPTWIKTCSSMLSMQFLSPSNRDGSSTTSLRSSKLSSIRCTCQLGTVSWGVAWAPTWPTNPNASFICTGARLESSSGAPRTTPRTSAMSASSDRRLVIKERDDVLVVFRVTARLPGVSHF